MGRSRKMFALFLTAIMAVNLFTGIPIVKAKTDSNSGTTISLSVKMETGVDYQKLDGGGTKPVPVIEETEMVASFVSNEDVTVTDETVASVSVTGIYRNLNMELDYQNVQITNVGDGSPDKLTGTLTVPVPNGFMPVSYTCYAVGEEDVTGSCILSADGTISVPYTAFKNKNSNSYTGAMVSVVYTKSTTSIPLAYAVNEGMVGTFENYDWSTGKIAYFKTNQALNIDYNELENPYYSSGLTRTCKVMMKNDSGGHAYLLRYGLDFHINDNRENGTLQGYIYIPIPEGYSYKGVKIIVDGEEKTFNSFVGVDPAEVVPDMVSQGLIGFPITVDCYNGQASAYFHVLFCNYDDSRETVHNVTKVEHDDTYHWSYCATCTCLLDSDGNYTDTKSPHRYTATVVKEATATQAGEKNLVCSVCGYSKTVKTPMKGEGDALHVRDSIDAVNAYMWQYPTAGDIRSDYIQKDLYLYTKNEKIYACYTESIDFMLYYSMYELSYIPSLNVYMPVERVESYLTTDLTYQELTHTIGSGDQYFFKPELLGYTKMDKNGDCVFCGTTDYYICYKLHDDGHDNMVPLKNKPYAYLMETKTVVGHDEQGNEILTGQTHCYVYELIQYEDVGDVYFVKKAGNGWDDMLLANFENEFEPSYHEHTEDTVWKSDDRFHWKQCLTCHDMIESTKGEHAWGTGVVTKEATTESEGIRTYTCMCGKVKTETIDKLKVPAHTHTESGWKSDEDGHWKECTDSNCKEVIVAKSTHVWDVGTETAKATTETTGVMTYKCTVCGFAKTTTIDKLPTPAAGTETKDDSGLTFTVKQPEAGDTSGAVEVEFTVADTTSTKVDIPSTVTINGVEATVTTVADSAFEGNKTVTEVTIPSTVEEIGDNAFKGCTSLTTVSIPTSVEEIGDSAFSGCKKLKKVTIPAKVETVGKNAFLGCSSLTTVTIKSTTIKTIEQGAFKNCTKLTKVTVTKSVTKIGKDAFSGDKKLKIITITSTKIKSIGKNAFKGVPKTTIINVPKKQKKAYTKLLKKAGFKGKIK